MSLWHLLTLLSGAAAFGGAVSAARVVGGGATRLLMGVALGLCLGTACVYAARAMGERSVQRIRDEASRNAVERMLRWVYFAAVAWCFVSAGLCFQIARAVLGDPTP
jgi:hypothetical protein